MMLVVFIAFIFAAFALFCFICAMSQKHDHLVLKAAFCLAAAPVLLSWLSIYSMWVLPHHMPGLYIAIALGFMLVMALAFHKQWPKLLILYKESVFCCRAMVSENRKNLTVFCGVVLILMIFLAMLMRLPLTSNDTLNYVSLMKLLKAHLTPAFYPTISSYGRGGFIAPYTHPLGYPGLMFFTSVLSMNSWSSVMRFLGGYYYIVNAVLIFSFLAKERPFAGLLAMFVLMTTPLFFSEAASCSIDAFRMALLLVAILNIACLLEENGSFKYSLVSGVLLGLNMYTHSINILGVFIFAGSYIAVIKSLHRSFIKPLLIVLVVAFLFVIVRMGINLHVFGAIIADKNPIWGIKSLHFYALQNVTRFIDTPYERWVYGFFSLFTRPNEFFLTYWTLVIAGLLLLLIKVAKRPACIKDGIITCCVKKVGAGNLYWFLPLSATLIFYMMIFVSVVIGMNAVIKNGRYMMTTLPFIAILLGIVVDDLLTRYRNFQYFLIPALLLFLIPNGLLARSNFNSFLYVGPWKQSDWLTPLDQAFHSTLGVYKTMYQIQKTIPVNSRILAFQESDIDVYIHHKYISSMDLSLLPVYEADSKEQAFQNLKKLGIDYIYIPYYLIPTFTQSWINKIANDWQYASIYFQSGATRVYKLRAKKVQVQLHQLLNVNTLLSNNHSIWYTKGQASDVLFTGSMVNGSALPYKINEETVGPLILGDSWKYDAHSQYSIANSYKQYLLTARFYGVGVVSILLYEYDKNNVLVRTLNVAKMPIISRFSSTLETSFKLPKHIARVRLGVMLRGPAGQLGIKNITLYGEGGVSIAQTATSEAESMFSCEPPRRKIRYVLFFGRLAPHMCSNFYKKASEAYYQQSSAHSAQVVYSNPEILYAKPQQYFKLSFAAKGIGHLFVATGLVFNPNKKVQRSKVSLSAHYQRYSLTVPGNTKVFFFLAGKQTKQKPYFYLKNVKAVPIK